MNTIYLKNNPLSDYFRYSTCGTGYTINFDSGKCEDTDECAFGTHNCDTLGPSYFCRNIKVKSQFKL